MITKLKKLSVGLFKFPKQQGTQKYSLLYLKETLNHYCFSLAKTGGRYHKPAYSSQPYVKSTHNI